MAVTLGPVPAAESAPRRSRLHSTPVSAVPWLEPASMVVAALAWLLLLVPSGYQPGGWALCLFLLGGVPAILTTEPWRRLPTPVWGVPVAVTAAGLLTLATTTQGWTSPRYLAFFVASLLATVCVAAYAHSPRRRLHVLVVVCLAGAGVFLAALPGWVAGGNPDALLRYPIGWHNQMADFLLPAALAGAVLVAGDSRRLRTLGGCTAALAGAGIVLTTSRAGIGLLLLGWVAAGGYAGTRPLRRPALLRVGAVALGSALAVLVLTSPLFFPHASYHFPLLSGSSGRGTSTLAPSTSARLQYVQAALRAWSHSPLVGRGFGAFQAVSAPYLPAGSPHYAVVYNLWVDALVSGGLLFALPLLAAAGILVLRLGRSLLAARPLAGRDGAVLAAASLCLLVLLGHAAFDVDIDYPACGVLLGVIAGLALACTAPAPRMPGRAGAAARLAPAALLATVLVATACAAVG